MSPVLAVQYFPFSFKVLCQTIKTSVNIVTLFIIFMPFISGTYIQDTLFNQLTLCITRGTLKVHFQFTV